MEREAKNDNNEKRGKTFANELFISFQIVLFIIGYLLDQT